MQEVPLHDDELEGDHRLVQVHLRHVQSDDPGASPELGDPNFTSLFPITTTREADQSDADQISIGYGSDIDLDTHQELSDDGFDRQNGRSRGYESGSDCEFIVDETTRDGTDNSEKGIDITSNCSGMNSEIVTFGELIDIEHMDVDGSSWADQWFRTDEDSSHGPINEDQHSPWMTG